MKKIFLMVILLSTVLFSQNWEDALLPFYGFEGSQSIGIGIGNATVASGQVIPEFTSNPANLGLQRFKTLEMTYTSSEFTSSENNIPQSNFGTVSFIYPMKVYRGSIVLATSLEKEREFAMSFEDVDSYGDDYKMRHEGIIRNWHFAVASEISKNLFVGADFILPFGEIDISVEYPNFSPDSLDYTQSIDYNGITGTIGIYSRMSKHLNWGIGIDLPQKMNVSDNHSYYGVEDYSTIKPLTIHAGVSALYKYLNLFYEAEWTNWRNMEFDAEDLYQSDITDINEEIETNLSQTIAHKVGAGIHVPFIPLHLYGGYQILPKPHSDENRTVMSGGFSVLVHQQISIHGSYQTYSWDYEKTNGSLIKENWNQVVMGASLHF
ncbi:MAG: hypothetical protein U9N76_03195 [Candidatus Marinimicrobia bacterium]|nr:hypothetical protein [Candidatus Neomarinimicrobiota bacterium]